MRHRVDELAEKAGLTSRDLHPMEEVPPAEAAGPTPVVLANIAGHVRASSVLLDQGRAARAGADLDSRLILAPLLKLVHVLAFARLAVVRLPAGAAHAILALRAGEKATSFLAREQARRRAGRQFWSCFSQINDLVAVGCDTKHKILLVSRHALVLLELSVLLECLRTDELLDLLKSRHAVAPVLRALEVVMPILLKNK